MTELEYQLNPELLHKHGTEVLNYLCQRLQLLDSSNIKPDLQPGELAARFASNAPQSPQKFAALLKDLENKIMPGVTHWQHPRLGGRLIQNTAGEALVVIMTSARIHKHLQLCGVEKMESLSLDKQEAIFYRDSSKLVVYMSDQTHFSGPKAVRVAGMSQLRQ